MTNQERYQKIIQMFNDDKMNVSQISEKLQISTRTVYRYLRFYKKKVPVESIKEVGPPQKINPKIRTYLGQVIKKDKTISAKGLKNKLLKNKKLKITPQAIRNNLKKMNYDNSKPKIIPLISDKNKTLRVEWCKNNNNTDWKNVLFTDETYIQAGGFKGSQWHKKSCRSILMKPKYPAKIMFWAGISFNYKTDLISIEGNMNSKKYIEMINTDIIPKIPKKLKKKLIFQQDNASCHISRMSLEYFTSKNINLIKWPASSPDLNPIENVWSILKDEVSKRCPKNKNEIILFAKEEWAKINILHINNMIDSMPKRLSEVINKKGNKCDY